jgi:FkbM family methyltransferase
MIITSNEFDSAQQLENGLKERFSDLDFTKLTYLDLGAGLPEFYSNSLHFRNKGVKVISVDANAKFCMEHKKLGYGIHNYAIVTDDRTEVVFREYPNDIQGLAFSSIADGEAEEGRYYVEYTIPSITIQNLLKENKIEAETIDIIDLDIEGGEIEIIKSLELEKLGVKGMIVENIEEDTEYYKTYTDLGYEVYARCKHNDIIIKTK